IEKVPWVFTVHNVAPAEHLMGRFFSNARLHYAVRDALVIPKIMAWRRLLKIGKFSAAICHSETVANRLRRAGCPPQKIVDIPFGSEMPASAMKRDAADPSPFPPGAWPKMVTVGGISFPKGQLDAIRMASRLIRDFPKLSFRVIGTTRDNKYRAYIEK